ncbi:MAG: Rrf2 family transcriptional regulator [Gammaproteobacteria bacterium]
MRLTVYTDYALRVLIYVALKPTAVATINEIAQSYGISRNHLMKVVHRLGMLGYLETLRGKNGGIRLARAPSEINLGEVVRDTEEDMALVECFQPLSGNCRIQPECVLRNAIQQALSAFMQVLDGYTLAHLIKPNRNLAARLAIPVPDSPRR